MYWTRSLEQLFWWTVSKQGRSHFITGTSWGDELECSLDLGTVGHSMWWGGQECKIEVSVDIQLQDWTLLLLQ